MPRQLTSLRVLFARKPAVDVLLRGAELWEAELKARLPWITRVLIVIRLLWIVGVVVTILIMLSVALDAYSTSGL